MEKRISLFETLGLKGQARVLLIPGLLMILVILFLLMLASGGEGQTIMRVSTDAQGREGNGESQAAAITNDGRRVGFASEANNLVAGDTNGVEDVFLKDTWSGVVVRYSTDSAGGQGNGNSFDPTLSQDGTRIAFSSAASNLVPGDSNGVDDIFVKDTASGATSRVSTATGGAQANGPSELAMISADGRYVVFTSSASNLVAGDSNGVKDVFVKDTQTDATTRVSTDSSGAQANGQSGYIYGPDISADGQYAIFSSQASNLVPGDSNNAEDVFMKDTQTGAISRVSTDGAGAQANGNSFFPAVSDDGQYVSFRSVATNLVPGDADGLSDIYRKDTQTGAINLVSTDSGGAKADRDSWDPSISPDGGYVVFATDATNLSASDTNNTYDVYMKQIQTDLTVLVSANADGAAGNGWSFGPVVASDGAHSAFQSEATDLVPGDSNGVYDVYSVAPFLGDGLLWTWYDEVGGDNWVLVANPEDAPGDLWFDLYIGGNHQLVYALPGQSPGQVPPGEIVTPRYLGLIGGPVQVGQLNSAPALVSQRVLWPSGGDSLEEVVGVPAGSLSNQYYWAWYDQLSAGMTNWILVTNPNPFSIYYRVRIGGSPQAGRTVAPGRNDSLTLPGLRDGPVEVEAWTDAGMATPADVLASQRVLAGYGTAFNEQVGVTGTALSSRYLWTWYDNTSPGARDWILIANKPDGPAQLHFEIYIGDNLVATDESPGTGNTAGTIAPGGTREPTFPLMDGPVEVRTYSDAGHSAAAESIASQRIIWGPSFGEVPGFPYDQLNPSYHWTWYDQFTPGVSNWVLIANPSDSETIEVEIWMNGARMRENDDPAGTDTWTLAPGERATPTFGDYIGGPVEARSYISGGSWTNLGDHRDLVASQRVLWKGFFNEVNGTVISGL